MWKLQGNEEDYYWSLKEVGDGLNPQERIYFQGKIIAHFKKSPHSIPLSEITTKIGTSYKCLKRLVLRCLKLVCLREHK